MGATAVDPPYLQFDGITKSFPGVKALKAVSFGVRSGSVHALMGENGAGKSTLLKVLSGVYVPDDGRLVIGGTGHRFMSTAEAIEAGVAVIYQELHLVPEMSVAENLYLGHLPNTGGWIDRATLRQRARRQMEMLGEDIDPRVRVGALPLGQRQMVEIAKALTREATVIAFDEPTSSLSSRETDRLFEVIGRLKEQGRTILYVSHRMDEIEATCDAATVLRDGSHVETFESLAGVGRDVLVQRMVGRKIEDVYRYTPRGAGAEALEVTGVTGRGVNKPATFSVRAGEILGFFGLVGAGRTELLKILYGAARRASGTVTVAGKVVTIRSPHDALAQGIILCPEDRKKDGIFPLASVMENLNIAARRQFSAMKVFIRGGVERRRATEEVARLAVKTPSLRQPIKLLSGGNQQKVILARWLSRGIKVALFDEPTRGIDVGAKSEIYSIIYRLAESGVAVVVVSSELPEVLGICDRICVMRQGGISGCLSRAEATQERVLHLALPFDEGVGGQELLREAV